MSTLKHSISTEQVNNLKSKYDKNKNNILKDPFNQNDTLPTSETFERAAFDKILAQDGCVGVRIYYGMDDDLQVKLILIGVDKNGQDIQTTGGNLLKKQDGDISDDPIIAFSEGLRCPPNCAPPPPPPPPDEP